MKRKIKRKLFLMGMAMTTGLPGMAHAKGSGKQERDALLQSGQWYSATSTFSVEHGSGQDKPAALLSKLGAMLEGMHYSGLGSMDAPAAGSWRLEMLPPGNPVDPGNLGEQTDNPNSAGEKRFGLAVRLAF